MAVIYFEMRHIGAFFGLNL